MNKRSSAAPRSGTKLGKKILFSAIAATLGLLLLEGLLSFLLVVTGYVSYRSNLPSATQFKEDFHSRHDPDLGWVNIPGTQLKNFYGQGRSITINEDGLRDPAVKTSEDGRFRIVCVGDSFTLGYGVDDKDTYPAQLEVLHPGVRALNMGQGGYSVGQSFLWYQRDGTQLHADCVVFAFIVDDIWRLTESRLINGAAMPQFNLENGRLQVTGQPVPIKVDTGQPIDDRPLSHFLMDHSALCKTLGILAGATRESIKSKSQNQQIAITLAILKELHRTTKMRRSELVILLIPELHELMDPQAAELHHSVSGTVRRFAEKRGLPFLDLFGAFDAIEETDLLKYYLLEQWNHLSESGNHLVAKQLDSFMRRSIKDYPRASFENNISSRSQND